ncbi:p21-activated protein kinase-interacting protein 1-like [Macadamia integrifolia]|uniref:p21-activated protein kinase-interacting protein 1-like n=1 Tax=Macadamia integrifolia TaxID=60698 RepID=UPI001C4E9567|nr:p21-activated protein kinase-interacting protein 1-like [Macadamia integrifolia]
MTLVAGSYEKFIWGYKLKTLDSPTLKPLFSYPSHLSAIKCVAVAGPVAVSGGADDAIKIYDLSTSSEVGTLMEHKGAITALSFYTPPSLSFPRNLLSGSEDGTVCIYDADPFVHLKTLSPHKKGINDLAIHPSGRLALSVGRDSSLAMLNLVRGKRSFHCKLGKEATMIRFDCDGNKFFMVTDEKISVHESGDAKLIFEMESQKRVLSFASGTNGLLFAGGEDRNVTAWDTKSGKVAFCIEGAHSSRVKGIVVLTRKDGGDDADVDDPYIVASASSDGIIRVWDVRMAKKEKPNPLVEANTKSRLTCLAGSSIKSFQKPQMGNCVTNKQQDIMMEDS